jgi:hypothetical protein
VHQDQVNVVGSETLERLVNNLGDILVLHVVDLGGKEDLLSGNARVLDTGTDLGLVAVSLGAVGRRDIADAKRENGPSNTRWSE